MSRPIQLILVDLDNLRRGMFTRGPLPKPVEGPFTSETWLEPRPQADDHLPPVEGSKPACVVVFAMNLETAADRDIEFDTLRAFGQRLACVVTKASLAGSELVLTLPVKQSADKALERLLRHAPLPEHAGMLESVHLLTEDKGLRDSIHNELGKKFTLDRRSKDFVWAWARDGKSKGASRQHLTRPRLVSAVDDAAPTDPAQAIDTPTLVAWAGGRPVGIRPGTMLQELVALLQRRPGLLTQVGPTVTSLRGIERMERLARGGRPLLGPCDAGDGLELCDEDVADGDYSQPSESSLGPGAVRLGHPRRATVRTLLPPAVVTAVESKLRVGHRRTLLDGWALTGVSLAKLSSSTPLKVRLCRKGLDLQAEITSPFGEPLRAWWMRKTETWDKHKIAGLGTMLSGTFTVHAIPGVIEDAPRQELVVRTPCSGDVMVELRAPLQSHMISAGKVGAQEVAVLGRADHRAPGAAVKCAPIQEFPEREWARAFPQFLSLFYELRQLPLMVPV